MTPDPRPLGLLGGTFDPIHLAHLRLAEEAREALGLATVRLIPAGRPPHRDAPASSPEHRLNMARLAVAGNRALEVDAGEVANPQASYTITTLERLRREIGPRRPLVLLVGGDAFAGLARWHRWQELFLHAHIAVANRPGVSAQQSCWPGPLPPELDRECSPRLVSDAEALARAPAGLVMPFDMTPLAISATRIRELCSAGRSCRYLLPESVLDYIGEHSLYR